MPVVVTEAVFTAPHDREVRVSADRQKITHRSGPRFTEYDHDRFRFWLAWFERKAAMQRRPEDRADAEVLRAARDLLVKEGVLA